MAIEPKTPGQVAWKAYLSTLIETPADYGPAAGDYTSPAWEAAAQAVRKQGREEMKATMSLLGEIAAEDMGRVRDIRKILAEWSSNPAKVMSKWTYFSANEVIEAIEDLLASPKQEEAAVCAEPAAAEQSKSPPPAKR